jgi:hypothetical protein
VATDGELARRAGSFRVLTIDDLRAAGLSKEAIRTRVNQGRLQRIWRRPSTTARG